MTTQTQKTFHMQTKIEDTQSRKISGFASTKFKDRQGDVVLPEALEKSMQIYSKNPVVLRDHNPSQPIGKMTDFKITEDGLFVVDEIGKGFKDADEAWAAIDQGILSAFSIGFIPLNSDRIDGEFVITELELVEHSVVSIPANRESLFSVEKALKFGTDIVSRETSVPEQKMLHAFESNLKILEDMYDVLTTKDKIRVDDIRRRFNYLGHSEEELNLEIEILELEKQQLEVGKS